MTRVELIFADFFDLFIRMYPQNQRYPRSNRLLFSSQSPMRERTTRYENGVT